MFDKQVQQVIDLATQGIGENYFTEDKLQKYLSNQNTFWRFAVLTDTNTNSSVEFKSPKELEESERIIGFIWGRVIPVREFTETRFPLPQIYSAEKVIFEVPTWVVHPEYQDHSIGAGLIREITEVIITAEVYPVISPVRESVSGSNDHLFFLSQYGQKLEVVPEKPDDVICSICGKNCTCQTVILQYSEDDISQLYSDVSE